MLSLLFPPALLPTTLVLLAPCTTFKWASSGTSLSHPRFLCVFKGKTGAGVVTQSSWFLRLRALFCYPTRHTYTECRAAVAAALAFALRHWQPAVCVCVCVYARSSSPGLYLPCLPLTLCRCSECADTALSGFYSLGFVVEPCLLPKPRVIFFDGNGGALAGSMLQLYRCCCLGFCSALEVLCLCTVLNLERRGVPYV